MARSSVVRAVVPLLPSGMQKRLDAWENALTGLGTALRDKRTQLRFRLGERISDEQLDAMYHDDDLAALIVDTIPDEAMREGWSLNIDAEATSGDAQQAVDLGQGIVDAADEFQTWDRFNEAWRWGRLFGGAGLFMGVDDGAVEQSEPLREQSIRRVRFLAVLDRRDFTPHTYFDDPDEDQYGEPKTYLLAPPSQAPAQVARGTGLEVHASRIIVFPGARTSRRQQLRNGGWDMSVLQRIDGTARDFHTAFGSVAHLLSDANQGVFKIKGLIEMIAGGGKEQLQTRMEIVDMGRSVVRALVLDADGEEFERGSADFSGIPEVLDRFMMRLSAATGIPVTLLMGRSPAGQNATGDSDFRAFFGKVKSARRMILKPRLERWLRVLMLSREGPTGGQEPARWGVEFPELWQSTQKEQAEIRKTVADTDQIYLQFGVLDAAEVRASRFRPEGYSSETVVDEDELPSPEPAVDPAEIEARIREEFARSGDPAPEPTSSGDGGSTDLGDPSFIPNGAQVQSMIGIVISVAKREVPRETGIQILQTAFPIDAAKAEAIMGEVGRSFFAGSAGGGSSSAEDAPKDPPQNTPPPPTDGANPDDD